MSVWVGVWLSFGKLTGGTGTSSLDKRYMTQWEHTLVNTRVAATGYNPQLPWDFIKDRKRWSICVGVCVCAWMHVWVHMSVYAYTFCIHAFVLVCASESSWGKLVVSTLLCLQVHPWCFLSLPGHSHSHRATLWLIAKYTGCCFRCWQQSLQKWLPFSLIGKQYPDTSLYSFMLCFIKVVIYQLQVEMTNEINFNLSLSRLKVLKKVVFVVVLFYCFFLLLTVNPKKKILNALFSISLNAWIHIFLKRFFSVSKQDHECTTMLAVLWGCIKIKAKCYVETCYNNLF